MGFLKSFKFWDLDATIESTVEATSKHYYGFKKLTPERDRHAWLAATFSGRPGYRIGTDVGAAVPFTRTTLYSILEDDDAVVALAYYFCANEMHHAVQKLEGRLKKIMSPVFDLLTQGKFFQKWEETNPWTAKNVSWIQEVIIGMEDEAQHGNFPLP